MTQPLPDSRKRRLVEEGPVRSPLSYVLPRNQARGQTKYVLRYSSHVVSSRDFPGFAISGACLERRRHNGFESYFRNFWNTLTLLLGRYDQLLSSQFAEGHAVPGLGHGAGNVEHDVLDLRELLQRIVRQVLASAAKDDVNQIKAHWARIIITFPTPLSLYPPWGISLAIGRWSLTQTVPHCSAALMRIALA